MRARWPVCLLILSLAGLPALADPPSSTTQKSDSESKKSRKKKKARGTKKQSKSKAARDKQAGTTDTDADEKRPPKRNLAAKGLKMVIKDATFENMTFADFTEWLARTTEANVVVRWPILEKGGVDRAFPIYLKQKNLRVRKILELVFSQVTHELDSVEIAAKADGNTLIISTRKDINTKRITRVYEAQHMLLIVPDFGGPPAPDPGGSGGARGSGGGGTDGGGRGESQGGGRITKTDKGGSGSGGRGRGSGGSSRGRRSGGRATGGPTSERQPDVDAATQRIIDYITSTIQPLSWKVNGGKGTIRYYKGKLVVYNNLEVHQTLAEMLPKAGQ